MTADEHDENTPDLADEVSAWAARLTTESQNGTPAADGDSSDAETAPGDAEDAPDLFADADLPDGDTASVEANGPDGGGVDVDGDSEAAGADAAEDGLDTGGADADGDADLVDGEAAGDGAAPVGGADVGPTEVAGADADLGLRMAEDGSASVGGKDDADVDVDSDVVAGAGVGFDADSGLDADEGTEADVGELGFDDVDGAATSVFADGGDGADAAVEGVHDVDDGGVAVERDDADPSAGGSADGGVGGNGAGELGGAAHSENGVAGGVDGAGAAVEGARDVDGGAGAAVEGVHGVDGGAGAAVGGAHDVDGGGEGEARDGDGEAVPELASALEAVLMVVDEPIPTVQFAQVLETPRVEVEATLRRLAEEYTAAGRGFDLREVAGGWRFYSRPECAPIVERFILDGQQARLTQAALETLAVIAYRQPVSRARVSAIRGVNCDGVVRTLISRGLIEEAGTEQESNAVLYRTTTLFLERLGLQSVDDLPDIAPYLPEVDEFADSEDVPG